MQFSTVKSSRIYRAWKYVNLVLKMICERVEKAIGSVRDFFVTFLNNYLKISLGANCQSLGFEYIDMNLLHTIYLF
jgi:hypothetical protein